MLQVNPHVDPLVEILWLAYRRGLAIRQEQEQSKAQPQAVDDKEQVLKTPKDMPAVKDNQLNKQVGR
jgi:hypothetical protein